MRETFVAAIVEPNALYREGLARILRASRFRILVSAPLLDDAASNVLAEHNNVLLVIGSGDDHQAMIRQIELFKAKNSAGRVAVVTDRHHQNEAVAAFRAGANAYFAGGTSGDAFIKSLDLVMLGETLMPAAMLMLLPEYERVNGTPLIEAELTRSHDTPQLSMQEKRILRSLVEGDSNKVIARKVSIAEATVKVHIKAILRKLRVHNRTQAAVWAINTGSFDSAISGRLEDLERP